MGSRFSFLGLSPFMAKARCLCSTARKQNSGETVPTLYLLIVAAIVASVSLAPFLACASFSSFSARRNLLSVAIVATMAGQTAVAMQALQAIGELDIEWTPPVKVFIQFLSMVFDGFQTGVTCFVEGASFTTSSFVLQLLAFPAFVVVSSLPAAAFRVVRGVNVFRSLLNTYGVILVALLTAISIAVVMPLKCRMNPNLTAGLVGYPT